LSGSFAPHLGQKLGIDHLARTMAAHWSQNLVLLILKKAIPVKSTQQKRRLAAKGTLSPEGG
jgi:hypothetical protein